MTLWNNLPNNCHIKKVKKSIKSNIYKEIKQIANKYNIAYEDVIDELVGTRDEDALKYKIIVENSIQGIIIIANYCIVFANSSFEKITGYTSDELYSLSPDEVQSLVHPDDRALAWEQYRRRLAGKEVPKAITLRTIRKDGSICWNEAYSAPIQYLGQPASLATFIDITRRKEAEESLLEQSVNLQETNSALRVLLKKRDEDRIELEEKLLLNIKETVSPYLEKLKRCNPTLQQENYLNIIESNLNDMASPLIRSLSSKFIGFTPSEMQVANLTRQGKSVKEIAELLSLSPGTIKSHRNSIRKKLAIKNTKINLRSRLLSFQ